MRKIIPYIFLIIHLLFVGIMVFPIWGTWSLLLLVLLPIYLMLPYKVESWEKSDWLMDVLFFTLGFLLTFWVQISFGYSSVFAASAVGLFASLFPWNTISTKPIFRRNLHHIPGVMYSGCFAGMTSIALIGRLELLFLLCLLGGSTYYITRNSFVGIGGKLGSIAFGAVSVVLLIHMYV